jgi:hypothetical protein
MLLDMHQFVQQCEPEVVEPVVPQRQGHHGAIAGYEDYSTTMYLRTVMSAKSAMVVVVRGSAQDRRQP